MELKIFPEKIEVPNRKLKEFILHELPDIMEIKM